MIRDKLFVCGAALLLMGVMGMATSWDGNRPYQVPDTEANQLRGGACTRLDFQTNICTSTCMTLVCEQPATPGTTGGNNPSNINCMPKQGITSCGGGMNWVLLGDNQCMPGG
jgi:hypothetical protein